jgi:hypothetical protein
LVAAAAFFSTEQAFCQQEVAPDHFDQPAGVNPSAKSPSPKGKHNGRGKTNMADKRSKKHHAHATA